MAVCGRVAGVRWSDPTGGADIARFMIGSTGPLRMEQNCSSIGWPGSFPKGLVDPYGVMVQVLSRKHVIKQLAWADTWTGPGAEAGRRDGLVECTQWPTSLLSLHLAPIGRSSQGKRLAAHQTFPPAYHCPPQRFYYCTLATQTGCNRRIQPTIVANSPYHAPLARLKWAEPTSAILYLSKRWLTVGGLPNILNATDWQ